MKNDVLLSTKLLAGGQKKNTAPNDVYGCIHLWHMAKSFSCALGKYTNFTGESSSGCVHEPQWGFDSFPPPLASSIWNFNHFHPV